MSGGSPDGSAIKNPPADAGDTGAASSILGQENPLEKKMATHSRRIWQPILTWRILSRVESGGLQSMGHKESDVTEQLTIMGSRIAG